MADIILQMIRNYEDKIAETEDFIENNDTSIYERIGLSIKIENCKEFIGDLEFLLNSYN